MLFSHTCAKEQEHCNWCFVHSPKLSAASGECSQNPHLCRDFSEIHIYLLCCLVCIVFNFGFFFKKLCLVLYSVNPFLLYFVAVFVLMGSEAVIWPGVSKWSMRIGEKVQQSHLLQQEWEHSHEYLIDCSDGCAHPHVIFECFSKAWVLTPSLSLRAEYDH